MALPKINYLFLAPELLLTTLALLLILADLFLWEAKNKILAWLAIFSLVVTGLTTIPLIGLKGTTLSNLFVVDSFALFFKAVFFLTAILVILMSIDYVSKHHFASVGEFYTLILFATIGMMFMSASTDLIMIYVALELMSISCYICAGYHKKDAKSNEAILKYFLLGLIASALMLYGFSFIYGFTGQTELHAIAKALSGQTAPFAVILGIVFSLAGFAFKIASVPFHQWVPDVFEGAPTPVTAFLSVGPKAAAFAALARILFIGFPAFVIYWKVLFIILAIASMFVGNLLALMQTNIKRMLAYSTIAHAGYILIGYAVANKAALAGVLIYLVAYLLMNGGAFAVAMAVAHEPGSGFAIADFSGLSKRNPFLALAMAVFLIALIGLPPTAGLWGKVYIFLAAVKGKLWWLALIGFLNSVISLYYYVNVIRHMYLFEPKTEKPLVVSNNYKGATWIALAGTLIIGFYPQPLVWLSQLATKF